MVFNKPTQKASSQDNAFQKRSTTSKDASLAQCLEDMQQNWKQKSNLAGLIQDWEDIAGTQLASNCIPLSLHHKTLVVGASHPQWRQALLYNRQQLLKALITKGYGVKEIRIQQYHHEKAQLNPPEKDIWKKHPSRQDIHGASICSACGSPSPKGEITLWGKCIFCRRKDLSIK